MTLRLVAAGFGVLFGFVLGWARLTEYDTIRDMLLLREPDVFLLMGSAVATAAIGARLLRRGGMRALVDGTPIGWTTAKPTRDHVVGSMLFGLGWSVACSCPGPIAAQLGSGQLAGAFTAAGLLAGVALSEELERRRAALSPAAAPGGEVVAATAGPCAGL
jgi:uncharacterized membrane protein YedE/YeeE